MNSLLNWFSAFCFVLAFSTLSLGQEKSVISGVVFEAETEQTIVGAHVFLNGTTLGAITTDSGSFHLDAVPEGVYQLVVKFLGFQDHILQINTKNNTTGIKIYLKESVYKLNEITVISNRKQWKERFDLFRTYFLGVSANAEDTKILNPEVLSFEVDPITQILTAEAYESLKIKNNALGYSIEFYLEHFSYDRKEGTSAYFGFPVYSELESRRRRTNSRWAKNRKSTYKGSFQHFITALIARNYYEEGFEIKAEMHKTRQELVRKNTDSINIAPDSSFFATKTIAGGARYLSRDTVDIRQVFYKKEANTYVLKFINFLNVTYLKENETYAYRKWNEGKFAKKNPEISYPQNSLLTLTTDSLLIDKSGFIYNPTHYLVGGYWAFERLSDLLPINFKAKEN